MWKFLVLLHALAGIVLLGASTHHAIIAIGTVRGVFRFRLSKLYALIVVVAYSVTFGLGALAYPRFRHLVRAVYLDEYAACASRLFEAKEDLASLALPLVLSSLVMAYGLHSKTEKTTVFGYAFAVTAVALVVWFNVICGLLITMTKAA